LAKLSYKFLNIVAALPAGDHANPQGTEWLRQDVSSSARPLQRSIVRQNQANKPVLPGKDGVPTP
jgi:hypothetical protein